MPSLMTKHQARDLHVLRQVHPHAVMLRQIHSLLDHNVAGQRTGSRLAKAVKCRGRISDASRLTSYLMTSMYMSLDCVFNRCCCLASRDFFARYVITVPPESPNAPIFRNGPGPDAAVHTTLPDVHIWKGNVAIQGSV